MTYDEYNAFCKSLRATTHVVQWGGAEVWKVGGKVFAIGGWQDTGGSQGSGPAYTFKVSELNYDILKEQTGFRPAPYLASRGMKWIQQTDSNPEKDEELKYYLSESHRIVSLGLSKKRQRELGLLTS